MRPIPDELRADNEAGMSINAMKRKHKAGHTQMMAWLETLGRKAKIGRPDSLLPGLKELAPTMLMKELAAHYGTHEQTVRRQCRALGIAPRDRWSVQTYNEKNRAQAPANFIEIAEGKTINAVVRITGRVHTVVKRWFKEHGLTPGTYRIEEDPLPADWHIHAAVETNRELGARYGRSHTLITRWRKASGIYRVHEPKAVAKRVAAKFARQPAPKRVWVWKGHNPAPIGQRDDTVAGRAADHMRRERWIVTRCNAAKMFDPKGDHYRVGSLFMTAEELVGMAERKGFVAHPERMAA